MTLHALMDQTGTRVRPAATSGGRYNLGPGGVAARKTYRCRKELLSKSEASPDRSTQITEWILFLPHDADVLATDLWEQGGATYQVIAPPEVARARGRTDHIEVTLRLVKA